MVKIGRQNYSNNKINQISFNSKKKYFFHLKILFFYYYKVFLFNDNLFIQP